MSSEMAQRPNAADVLEVVYAQVGEATPQSEVAKLVYEAHEDIINRYKKQGLDPSYEVYPVESFSSASLVAEHRRPFGYTPITTSKKDVTSRDPLAAGSFELDLKSSGEIAVVFAARSRTQGIEGARWALEVKAADLDKIQMHETRYGLPVSRWTGAMAVASANQPQA